MHRIALYQQQQKVSQNLAKYVYLSFNETTIG